MPANIHDGELNKNDMTHDELYFKKHLTQYMDILKGKLSLTHNHHKQTKNKTTTTTTRSNCMVRVYKVMNNIKVPKKKSEYVNFS